jgi:hypothetical protein
MNILKIVLIGGGAYLAYDFWKKRGKNEILATTPQVRLAGAEAPVSKELVSAEIQEEGEEGVAVEEMNNANGWDSDTISDGLI